MTENEFRDQLKASGYNEPTVTTYEPNADGQFHAHDFSAMLMVTEGEFRLVLEDETKTFSSGEWCEVPAGTVHYEQSGSEGALVLAGKKPAENQ